jgi:hypothetical protein
VLFLADDNFVFSSIIFLTDDLRFRSPLMETLPKEFSPPKTLEEWSEIAVFHFDPRGTLKRK